MEISRLSFKVFMDQGEDVTPETWFEVFNTWIHEPENDILVDVADYTHVLNGPQTILVGHRANYAIDNTDGRFGFLYGRKRDLGGNLAESLLDVISTALRACNRLNEDGRLDGQVSFNSGSVQIIVNDRLGAANETESFENLKTALTPILNRLYGGAAYEVSRDEGEGRRLSVDVQAEDKSEPSQLLENLRS
tara:strand:+ start:364 stop:939 length:576 start_codon:yes stop_codon:yes gene_type:complete